ncbi:MAG: hypothetical protein M1816_004289 [Peltula sp. TS41687]|nr:MAG: hypothetical protein M1816_004289 [Peltula sp. TS41687]
MPFFASTDFTQRWLTPSFLQSLHDFWFRTLSPNDIVPCEDSIKRWFMRAEDIDRLRRETYLPFLEDVQNYKPSPHDLLPDPYANPSTTLTTITLLDQIPRNVFRGAESKTVFTVFDPLALDISLRSLFPKIYQLAMERLSSTDTVNDQINPRPWYETEAAILQDEDENQGLDNLAQFCYHLGHRFWKYNAMLADVESLLNVSNEVKETSITMAKRMYQAGIDHEQLIERFGRYPHRTKPLGRENTPEEKDYLDKRGLTLGSDA